MDDSISILIPVYNESESILRLCDEINQVMNNLKKAYEIIFVDDGSTDDTFKTLMELASKAKENNVKFRCIRLRKNFGKSVALQVGFAEAKGAMVITLDGDLQDDPCEFPRFIEEINQGYDLVSGWKFNRHDPPVKTISSKIFNFVTSAVTGIKLHDFNCCFKIYRNEVVKRLCLYGELHRFIPALVYYDGFRVSEIKVNHRPRLYGKSKYGARRFLEGFFDLITVLFLTRFVRKPLHFFGNLGLLSSFFGFLIILILYLRKFVFGILIGQNQYLFFLGTLLVIVGFQFFSIGLLGELMIRITPQDYKKYIKELVKT